MRRVKKACVSSSAIPSWWSTQPSSVTLMLKARSPIAASLLGTAVPYNRPRMLALCARFSLLDNVSVATFTYQDPNLPELGRPSFASVLRIASVPYQSLATARYGVGLRDSCSQTKWPLCRSRTHTRKSILGASQSRKSRHECRSPVGVQTSTLGI
jgi:hypothetical protein